MRCVALVSSVAGAVACGRVSFDAVGDGRPSCVRPESSLGMPVASAFGAPVLVAELASPAFDDDPTLTSDQREIYFESARSGSSRIWRSVRETATAPWGAPAPVVELDGWMANTPEISRDGLRMRFASSGDLFLITRPDRASPWGAPALVAELTTASSETGAVEFFDGAALAFASDRPGGNPLGDLWETFRDSIDCTFAAPRVLAGLESTAAKANLWMRDDGLVVVFPRPGATGSSDLHIATRPDLETPFGIAVEQTPLSSTSVDDDPWLDDAMTSIYFMSARTGDAAIYHATR